MVSTRALILALAFAVLPVLCRAQARITSLAEPYGLVAVRVENLPATATQGLWRLSVGDKATTSVTAVSGGAAQGIWNADPGWDVQVQFFTGTLKNPHLEASSIVTVRDPLEYAAQVLTAPNGQTRTDVQSALVAVAGSINVAQQWATIMRALGAKLYRDSLKAQAAQTAPLASADAATTITKGNKP